MTGGSGETLLAGS